MQTKRLKPLSYGQWWENNNKSLDWYKELYESRKIIHEAFARWVLEKEAAGESIISVLEVGCGRAVGYADLFRKKRYVGYDISKKEIEWCKKNLQNTNHDYVYGDFLEKGINEKFDLVFSHAVIDHIYDINAFVKALVKNAQSRIYITAYRGWFPQLKTHMYRWKEEDTCFYNDISPNEIIDILRGMACSDIEMYSLATGNQLIPYETVITAKNTIR